MNIDIHSSVAVYVQIENQVQFAIASGKLSADKIVKVIEKQGFTAKLEKTEKAEPAKV